MVQMTLPKCTHRLGHKFEGRYSVRPGKMPSSEELFWTGYSTSTQLIKAAVVKTYERDVCVRCGHVIEKKATR
jgi:hypothetical protein